MEPGAIAICASLSFGTAAILPVIVLVAFFIRTAAALVATTLLILGDAHPAAPLIVIRAPQAIG